MVSTANMERGRRVLVLTHWLLLQVCEPEVKDVLFDPTGLGFAGASLIDGDETFVVDGAVDYGEVAYDYLKEGAR